MHFSTGIEVHSSMKLNEDYEIERCFLCLLCVKCVKPAHAIPTRLCLSFGMA